MSGSPVYVDDGGAKLVGAVSYGEYFTSNGLGLATPIEHMMALEDDFTIDPLSARLAKAVDLRAPLVVAGQTVRKVVVAPTTATARGVELDLGRRGHATAERASDRRRARRHRFGHRPQGRVRP